MDFVFFLFFAVQINATFPFLLTSPLLQVKKKVTKHIFLEEYMHLIAIFFLL